MSDETKPEPPDLRSLHVDSDEYFSLCLAANLGAIRIPQIAQSNESDKVWKVKVENP